MLTSRFLTISAPFLYVAPGLGDVEDEGTGEEAARDASES